MKWLKWSMTSNDQQQSYEIIYNRIQFNSLNNYSQTPIYRGCWGKGNYPGKSGIPVNRGFVLQWTPVNELYWGKGSDPGISGFPVNRGTVNRGLTVPSFISNVISMSRFFCGNFRRWNNSSTKIFVLKLILTKIFAGEYFRTLETCSICKQY